MASLTVPLKKIKTIDYEFGPNVYRQDNIRLFSANYAVLKFKWDLNGF